MIDKIRLGRAAWANDVLVDEGHGLPHVLRGLGIDFDDATYVSFQRALRMILAERGGASQMKADAYAGRARAIRLSPEETDRCAALAAVWLDGLAVGIRVARD